MKKLIKILRKLNMNIKEIMKIFFILKQMSDKEFYRILVFGPNGAGKSQFCNFVQRDLDNKINKVSDSLDSCT